jgi:hypothetical protein
MWSRSGSVLAGVEIDLCRRAFRWVWGRRAAGLVALALMGASRSLAAQRAIRVTSVRSLRFGTLLPGVPRTVLRTDPLNSGQLDIRAARNAQVQLIFTLPASLTGPAGASMPVSFGGNDGGFSATRSVTNQVGFDPRVPYVARFGRRATRASVFLGGTANPLTSQRAGSYTGTVTLTVVYFP